MVPKDSLANDGGQSINWMTGHTPRHYELEPDDNKSIDIPGVINMIQRRTLREI